MKTFETYLPIFNGFYYTIFDCDSIVNDEVYHINQERECKGLEALDYDEFEFDFKDYKNRIAEKCTEVIERELMYLFPSVSEVKFQQLISPKYYNFSNDSINIEIQIKDINEIIAYLQDNEEEFSKYIKERYSSSDGFISSHSNDYVDWLFALNNGEDLKHKLGSVLEFILGNEGYTTYDLYDGLNGENYIECTNYNELILN